MMSIAAKTQLEQETRLNDESFVIAESIRLRIFELEPQELQLIEDTASQTVIEIRHLYDVTTDVDGVITRDYSNPIIDILIFDKVNGVITYNGVQLSSSNIRVTDISSIELVPIEPSICNPNIEPCEQGILKLTLTLEIVLTSGHALEPQTFITTILV
jgi:hypothetical protein